MLMQTNLSPSVLIILMSILEEKQDFTEINETYRRVQALKSGYSDSKMPKTFKMKEALKRKNKVSQFIQE